MLHTCQKCPHFVDSEVLKGEEGGSAVHGKCSSAGVCPLCVPPFHSAKVVVQFILSSARLGCISNDSFHSTQSHVMVVFHSLTSLPRSLTMRSARKARLGLRARLVHPAASAFTFCGTHLPSPFTFIFRLLCQLSACASKCWGSNGVCEMVLFWCAWRCACLACVRVWVS